MTTLYDDDQDIAAMLSVIRIIIAGASLDEDDDLAVANARADFALRDLHVAICELEGSVVRLPVKHRNPVMAEFERQRTELREELLRNCMAEVTP